MTARNRSKLSQGFLYRLRAEMLRCGLSQGDIGKRLNTSPGTVSGWFTRGSLPHPRYIKALSEIFGVMPAWLLNGEEPKLSEESRMAGEQIYRTLPLKTQTLEDSGAVFTSIEKAGAALKGYIEKADLDRQMKNFEKDLKAKNPFIEEIVLTPVPVISWVQAGMVTEFDQLPNSWETDELIYLQLPKRSDVQAIGVRVRGDSMAPNIPENSVVVFLVNIPCRNGDIVVAHLKDKGFCVKILQTVGGKFETLRFKSFNPAFEPFDVNREDVNWMWPVDSFHTKIRTS